MVLKSQATPIIILAVMTLLIAASVYTDAATVDELAHVPAGYAYVFEKDYRLNPEHPPLIKDLSALSLAFLDVNFPKDTQAWQRNLNDQWTQGVAFLYEAGNDPAQILWYMRLPIILLAAVFGWALWRYTHRHFGERVALLTLLFYATSPTFITHSRFVTTDLGATVGFFIGITGFLRLLREPSKKNIVLAGLAFGTAQLLKFSPILLIPVWGILLVFWTFSKVQLTWPDRLGLFIRQSLRGAGAIGVALILIWFVYSWHVWNYPAQSPKPDGGLYSAEEIHAVANLPSGPDRDAAIRDIPLSQMRDAVIHLQSFRLRSWVDFDLWLIEHSVTRPLGQYFLGLFMMLQRASGGNSQYFLGEVTNVGWRTYFPILYLLKEPLPLHILTLLALLFALRRVITAPRWSPHAILAWIRDHFIEFSSLTFVAVYWTSSITSPLNIGVRHVLPTFPFIFMLVSKEIVAWLHSWRTADVQTWRAWLQRVIAIYVASLPRYLLVSVLILWQIVSVFAAYPYFLSYYNELGGGVEGGYRVAVDSNYDWGQDLRRLGEFARERGINTVYVDYFGGGNPRYELGEAFEAWWSSRGHPPGGGWFAISATFQMLAYGEPVRGFQRRPEDSYEWLKPYRPVGRAGSSIFIYELPPEPPRIP